MSVKVRMFLLGSAVGALLAAGMFSVGLAMGLSLEASADMLVADHISIQPTTDFSLSTAVPRSTPLSAEKIEVLFEPFWQAWDIVHGEYVDQPLDDTELMRGSISGMIDALGDPHSSYMDPAEFEQANAGLVGYEGIGAWVDTDAEILTIIAPIPGSPAEEAGLLPGDQVVAVDGEDVTGMDGNLAVQRILGPAGTIVHLTILREGEDGLLEFEIERARITIPSVEGEILEDGIAYIRLLSFAENTSADLRMTLDDLLAQDPRGLILDLRNNAGGYLNSAIDVSSEFIHDGVIVIERFGDGVEYSHKAKKGGSATEIPLIVLVNAGSASASEIVAGAIQDYDRGILVGEVTFGKGSVQQWIPLVQDQGAVRVTVAQWYTPKGRLIHEQGLVPDVEVEFPLEDWQAGNDPQLEAAMDLFLDNDNE